MSYLPDLQEISYKLFSGPGYNHHLPVPRITGIPRLPSPLSSKQVNPTVLYGKLSTVISSVQVDNLSCQSVYISSSHWKYTLLSCLSFHNCSAPCVYLFCQCCQSDITFGLRDGKFISSSHRALLCADTQQIIFSWINNRRPVVKDWVRLGEESFSGSQAQCVMKASGHLECVSRGQKILQYRQFIFLPFLTGTCIDVFFPSSPQLCLYADAYICSWIRNISPSY